MNTDKDALSMLDTTAPSLSSSSIQRELTEQISYIHERSRKIMRRRYVYPLFTALLLALLTVWLYIGPSQNRVFGMLPFLGFIEVLLIALAYINIRNYNLEHKAYRRFNHIFYGILGKISFVLTIVSIVWRLLSLLNPMRGYKQQVGSIGGVLLGATFDATITAPMLYSSFRSAEIVEEYFRLKERDQVVL